MHIYLALALGGLPIGAAYALQAMGMVVIYRTTTVFNFAQGALALVSAFVASALATGAHLPTPVAALLGVAAAVVVAVLMDLLTVRYARTLLARTVITLGWLILLENAVVAVFGDADRPPAVAVPISGFVHIGDTLNYSGADVALLAVTLVSGVGLGVFLRRSSLGTGMRAVSDDPEAARLVGLRVDRIRLISWALGGAFAGLSGALVAPLLGSLDTLTLVLITLQAVAAALVGRLVSLPWALAGGLALGAGGQMVLYATHDLAGSDDLLALVVVLVALLARRRTGRGDVGGGGLAPLRVRPLPTGRRAIAGGLGVLVVAAVLPLLGGRQFNFNLAQTAAWAVAVLSIVLLTGVVGQVPLCTAAFMGSGAFAAAILYSHGLPFLAVLPLAGIVAALVATVVGLPALRLAPLELAIATLSLSFAADYFFFEWAPIAGDGVNRRLNPPRFANGIPGAHGLLGKRAYAWLAILVFLLLAVAVARVRRGRTGSAMTALRSSVAATAAAGFSPVSVKLRGFAASGFIAGIAGALYAGLIGAASGGAGGAFTTTRSLTLLAFAVIAGVGSVPAAVVGGLIVTLSTLSFSSGGSLSDDKMTGLINALTGLLLIGAVLGLPEGLAGLASRLRDRVGRAPRPADPGQTGPPAPAAVVAAPAGSRAG